MSRTSAAALLALVCLVATAHLALAKSTTSIYSNIYVKGCHSCVAKESMHFNTATDAYMNYADGIEMADGTKAPAKQEFTKLDFSSVSRRLTATIDFSPKSIVLPEGDSTETVQKLVYDVTFATDFQSIKSGTVRASRSNSSTIVYSYSFCDEDRSGCPSFTYAQGTQYLRYIRYKEEEFDDIKDQTKELADLFGQGRQHDQAHISFIFFNFCLIIIASVFSCLVYKNLPR